VPHVALKMAYDSFHNHTSMTDSLGGSDAFDLLEPRRPAASKEKRDSVNNQ
jgi:hypothetical protein